MANKLLCTFTIDFTTGDWSITNIGVKNLVDMDDTFNSLLTKINVLSNDLIKINYK